MHPWLDNNKDAPVRADDAPPPRRKDNGLLILLGIAVALGGFMVWRKMKPAAPAPSATPPAKPMPARDPITKKFVTTGKTAANGKTPTPPPPAKPAVTPPAATPPPPPAA